MGFAVPTFFGSISGGSFPTPIASVPYDACNRALQASLLEF